MSQVIENVGLIKEHRAYGMNPSKFILWLFILTIVMLFAGLTSAFVVKQSDGNWFYFDLPGILWWTSGIILLSSVSMQGAYIAAKKNKITQTNLLLIVTTILGIAFLFGQYQSWKALVDQDVFFVGNPSGSFLYVLTGLHGLHLVTGIVFLLVVLFSSIKMKTNYRNLIRIELCSTYWHFLGLLWIYLFIFLNLNN